MYARIVTTFARACHSLSRAGLTFARVSFVVARGAARQAGESSSSSSCGAHSPGGGRRRLVTFSSVWREAGARSPEPAIPALGWTGAASPLDRCPGRNVPTHLHPEQDRRGHPGAHLSGQVKCFTENTTGGFIIFALFWQQQNVYILGQHVYFMFKS